MDPWTLQLSRRRVLRRVVLSASVVLGTGSCALVAGVDFDKARLDESSEDHRGRTGDGGGSDCKSCPPGMMCSPQGCVTDCPSGLSPCNGECVDTKTSLMHCGACGIVCPGAANADPTCNGGACRIACRTGFGDCTNNPPVACVPLPRWYVDTDGDEYGTTAFIEACVKPAGHAGQGGDCLDSNPAVHPDAGFSGVPFAGDAGPSFDYDCSGAEEEFGGTTRFVGCGGACNESGSDPLPPRAGSGVNDYCGSPLTHICFTTDVCNEIGWIDSGVPIQCR